MHATHELEEALLKNHAFGSNILAPIDSGMSVEQTRPRDIAGASSDTQLLFDPARYLLTVRMK